MLTGSPDPATLLLPHSSIALLIPCLAGCDSSLSEMTASRSMLLLVATLHVNGECCMRLCSGGLVFIKSRLQHQCCPLPSASIVGPQDKKGKGRPMDWDAEVSHEQRALEVLIGMTAKTLCRRSNTHLENALLLVEVSLGHANLHWNMLVEQHLAKKAAEAQEAAEAEAKKAREAAEREAQAEQQKQVRADEATASGTAVAQQAASTTETSGSGQQSTAGDKASQPSTTAGEGGATPTAAAQPVSKTGDTPSAPGASSSGPASDAAVPIPELNQQDDPGLVIQSLPEQLLKQLARLLGQSGLSELAQKRCASVIRMLVDMSPQLKPMMLSELQNELQRWAFISVCIP